MGLPFWHTVAIVLHTVCVDKVNHVIVSTMQCCVYEWWLDVLNALFLKLQVTDVTLYTACFNAQKCSFFTLTLVFVSFDSDNKRQLFSLNSMKWLGLIMKTPCHFLRGWNWICIFYLHEVLHMFQRVKKWHNSVHCKYHVQPLHVRLVILPFCNLLMGQHLMIVTCFLIKY